MPHRNSISVIREQESLLYQIMKDIAKENESITSSNHPEWKSVSNKIGRKRQLQDSGLLLPILKPQQHSKKSDMRVIKVPKDVEVSEHIKGKYSVFPFKRIK